MDKRKKRRLRAAILGAAVLALAVGVWWYAGQKPEYLFVMGSVRSFEDFPMFKNFEEEIQRLGGTAKVLEFEEKENSSINQIKMLKEAVNRNTACIILNASGNDNMGALLEECRERGIKVISCVSEVNPHYRELHVGAVSSRTAGPAIMEETAQICGGEGKFAIVSGSPHSEFSTTLTMEVRYTYEKREHPGMTLSDVIFGYEDAEAAAESIAEYLNGTPDAKALVCLSDAMTEGACMAVKELGMEEQVSVIGLGDPSYLEDYVEDENLKVELFYCDMASLGNKVAQLAVKLSEGEISGAVGEIVTLNGEGYQIKEDVAVSEDDVPGSELYLYEEYERYRNF